MKLEKYKILRIYVNEDTKYNGHNLYHFLTLKLRDLGLKGVTVIRGIEGFGTDKVLHTTRILDLSFDLPIIIEVIDDENKINEALPEISQYVSKRLITITDVNVVKFMNK